MAPGERTLRLVLAALRLLEPLAPERWRGRWSREWEAELLAWWRLRSEDLERAATAEKRRRVGSLALVWRFRHAVRDLFSLHLEEARARRRQRQAARAAEGRGRSPQRSGEWSDERSDRESEPMTDLLADVRLSLRILVRQPAFTAVAALTIAVALGANTTIFAFVNGILLQPLGFPEPDRLVAVWPEYWYSQQDFELVEESAKSYQGLAGYNRRAEVVLEEDGAKMWFGPRVTADFFRVLGVEPILGRTFAAEEDQVGNDEVVVLTHHLWQRRFGGDPEVVGKRVRASGGDRTIVGVLAPGTDLLQPESEIAFPQRLDRDRPTYQSAEMKLIGRLADGVSLEQAQAELESLVAGWREELGAPVDWGREARVVPLREFVVGEVRPTLLLLFAAVASTLLIATANVINLLLARTLSRRRELGVRVALGARSWRLVRQLTTESTVLALLGSVPGLLLAWLGVRAVAALLPSETPRLAEVSMDVRVVGFGVALALVIGWIVGLVGALQSLRTSFSEGLGGEVRGSAGTLRRPARSALVIAELALAVSLLAGAGLLVKSLWRLNQVDPGFDAEHLVKLDLHPAEERLASVAEAEPYFRRAEERLEALPGVASVATIWKAPLAPDGGVTFAWPAAARPRPGEALETTRYRPASPDYFRVSGIPLLEGRSLEVTDSEEAEAVAVLSRAAAQRLFPGRSALGEKVTIEMPGEVPATVVGVVGDVRLLGPGEASPATIYRPYSQVGPTLEVFRAYGRALVVRTTGPPAALASAMRETLRAHDPTALVSEHIALSDAIRASLRGRRVTLLLVAVFTLTAVLLGAIGIYGVMAYSVRARRQELGIRVALGASGRSVLRQVLGEGLRLALLGASGGLLLAIGLSRFLEGFVFQVATTDAWVLATAVALAVAVSCAATLLPALRAARADPVLALAAE